MMGRFPSLSGVAGSNVASWREEQGHGSDALGTLSWVSVNELTRVDDPGWSGCARALMAHGLPSAERDPSDPDKVLMTAGLCPSPTMSQRFLRPPARRRKPAEP